MTHKFPLSIMLLALSGPLLSADEQMQVTGSRIQLAVSDSLNDVIIIGRDAIEQSGASSLFEILRGQAGLDLIRRGGLGQQFSLFVRGANSNQILILIDGMEVGSATLGSKALSDLSLQQIERIELIKGPRAALWGSKALGGVLQIFTRDIDHLQLTLGTGSDGYQSWQVATDFNYENIDLQLLADHYDLDGNDARFDQDPDRDGSERDNLQLKLKWQLNEQHEIGYLSQRNEGSTEYDTSFGADRLIFDNQLDVIDYRAQFKHLNHQLKYSQQTDDSTSLGLDSPSFRFVTESELLRYQLEYAMSEEWRIGASAENLKEDVSDSDSDYTNSDRTTRSGHLVSHYKAGDWLNEIALRVTDVEALTSNTSTHVGIGYRIKDSQLLSINYGEGFKAPTFNDLYFPFGGNPELRHETSDALELTFQHWTSAGHYSISLFHTEVINLIQFVPDQNGFFSAVNVGEASLEGIDFSWNWHHLDVTHQLDLSYVDAIDNMSGDALPLRASEQLSYRLSGQVADLSHWSYMLQVMHTGERPDVDYQTFEAIDLDSYTEVHLSTTYQLTRRMQLQLRIDDLFNTQAINNSGYRPQGRTFQLFFKLI